MSENAKALAALERADAAWKPRHNQWAVALTVTLATFMEVLDTSIANVALPHIAGGLGASQEEATWVLTSYLVSSAIILPISGWLANRFGRKRFYMSCVAMFTACSLLCGLAQTLPLLILARILQGLGGGGLATSEQAILADTFPIEKRGQAFALYGMAVVVAPAIGPTLGGWITDNFNWHWIFFINVPVAIVSLFLTSRLVEDPPHVKREVALMHKRGLDLDYIGFALLGLGFGTLEFILDKGQEDDWFGSRLITGFVIVCVVAMTTLIFYELRQIKLRRKPILNLTLFKNRTFAISFGLMFILGFALFGTTVLIPQFTQTLLGYTAELAGMALSPGGFTVMVMMPVVGFLVGRVDPRYLIAYGFIMTSAALGLMLTLNLGVSYSYIAWLRVFQASGLAFLFVPINTIAYTDIPRSQNNDVSGLTNLARNVGGSVGTSFVATMLARRSQTHENVLAQHLTPGDPAYTERVNALARMFASSGGAGGSATAPSGQAQAMARESIYQQLHAQAAMLSYLDIISVLALFCAMMIPFVFFMKKRKGPAGEVAMH